MTSLPVKAGELRAAEPAELARLGAEDGWAE